MLPRMRMIMMMNSWIYVDLGVPHFQTSHKPKLPTSCLRDVWIYVFIEAFFETAVPHVPRVSCPLPFGWLAKPSSRTCPAKRWRLPNSHQMAHILQKHLATSPIEDGRSELSTSCWSQTRLRLVKTPAPIPANRIVKQIPSSWLAASAQKEHHQFCIASISLY